MHDLIRGCSDPLEVPAAGHFVQEEGKQVAEAALAILRRRGRSNVRHYDEQL